MYKPLKMYVVRMDYLPHLDSVSVTKIGLFGTLYNEIHRVDDLERREMNEDYEKMGALFKIHSNMETLYSYKNNKTGELFYFEKQGTWNWQGISHPSLDLNK